jgi:hypothetical protein
VRGVILGDSQETSPWGWGMHYVPFLNARLSEVFGKCSETMLLTNIDMVERPQWLATVMRAAGAATSTVVPPSAVLPGLAVETLVASISASSDFRAVLLHDSSRTIDPALRFGPWMHESNEHVVDVLVHAGGQACQLDWRSEPTDEDYPAIRPVVSAGNISFVDTGTLAGFVWATTPPLARGDRRHLQIALSPGAFGAPVDLVGVRFRIPSLSRGIVVQSLSAGGQRAIDLRLRHGSVSGMFRALGPSFAVFQLGANDAMEMNGPDMWRMRLQDAIAWIRETAGDPRFPVIIVSDIRGGSGGMPFEIIDRMPVIAHELASVDDRLMAINMRRVTTEEFLWGETTHYLADSAHFHPFAQRLLAFAFVGELCAALGINSKHCEFASDWADCVRMMGSACGTGGCVRMLDVEADHYNVPWNAGGRCADLNEDGVVDECPSAGRADLDRDGFIGGRDLGILLGSWGQRSAIADIDGNGAVDGIDLGILVSQWTG